MTAPDLRAAEPPMSETVNVPVELLERILAEVEDQLGEERVREVFHESPASMRRVEYYLSLSKELRALLSAPQGPDLAGIIGEHKRKCEVVVQFEK